MTYRTLFALTALTLAGCDRSAPSLVESDTDTDADSDTDTDTDADADTDTDADADTDTDTDTDADCGAPTPRGAWSGHPLDGLTLTTTPYTSTTGLAAVRAATPATGSATVDLDVTGAIVTFKDDFGAGHVWLAGGDGAMHVFGVPELTALEIGDQVDFTATEVTIYFGESEITAVDTASIAVTAQAQPVHYVDASSTVIDATHLGSLVEFFGSVGAAEVADCGNNVTCWPVINGATTNYTKVSNAFTPAMAEGECLKLLAPVAYERDRHRIYGSDFDAIEYY